MKTAAKVFLILSIVGSGFLMLVALILFGSGMIAAEIGVSFLGVMYGIQEIITLTFSIIGFVKLNKARRADDISIAWKIVVLIFSNLIAGILSALHEG